MNSAVTPARAQTRYLCWHLPICTRRHLRKRLSLNQHNLTHGDTLHYLRQFYKVSDRRGAEVLLWLVSHIGRVVNVGASEFPRRQSVADRRRLRTSLGGFLFSLQKMKCAFILRLNDLVWTTKYLNIFENSILLVIMELS